MTLAMADMARAWDAATVADWCAAGDVLIVRDAATAFTVWEAPGRNRMDADTRILSHGASGGAQ